MSERDRDPAGRPRNARPRDETGRPQPHGADDAPPVRQPTSPADAITLADELLVAGRPFAAHEVLEEVWHTAAPGERDLWQGLAQLCVGFTHLQRGNTRGAATLLRRGAGRLADCDGTAYDVDVQRVIVDALRVAEQIENGEPGAVSVRLGT